MKRKEKKRRRKSRYKEQIQTIFPSALQNDVYISQKKLTSNERSNKCPNFLFEYVNIQCLLYLKEALKFASDNTFKRRNS